MTEVAFSIPVRVYYEDTDTAGVVYYANYLRFMERCRSDWLRAADFDVRQVAQRHNLMFAVRSANVEYWKPARLSDLLTVSVAILKLGRVSLDVEQRIHLNSDLICEGRIRLASLDATTLTPIPIPDVIRDGIFQWKTP